MIGLPRRGRKVVPQRTPGELDAMAAAGAVVGAALVAVREATKPGVSTLELDGVAEAVIRDAGAVPSFKGYHGFPGSICSSVNDVVVHGIPSAEVVIADGDLVSIDCGAILDGWHGDSSRMFAVGEISPQAKRLIEVTHASMMAGIEAVKPGATLGDIGYACQQVAENAGYSVVQEFCGHGIGRGFHEEPQVLHYGRKGQGMELKPGMIFTVEPMINQGKRHLRILADGWTVVTKDRSLSAQWEHEVLVTDTGYEILTISPASGQP